MVSKNLQYQPFGIRNCFNAVVSFHNIQWSIYRLCIQNCCIPTNYATMFYTLINLYSYHLGLEISKILEWVITNHN